MAKAEPWRGVLVCTDRRVHDSLRAEFSVLSPHGVLSKWLYLPEAAEEFEAVGQRPVALVARRDPRLGVEGSTRARKKSGGTVGPRRVLPTSVMVGESGPASGKRTEG